MREIGRREKKFATYRPPRGGGEVPRGYTIRASLTHSPSIITNIYTIRHLNFVFAALELTRVVRCLRLNRVWNRLA